MGGNRLPGEADLLRALPILESLDPAEPTKMPLEARMYGMFAGFLASWAIVVATRRGRAVLLPPTWLLLVFVAFIGVMGVDGINATLFDVNSYGLAVPYLYAPRLDVRLATGLLSGIGIAGITLSVVNYALWREKKSERILTSLRDLATLLIWNAILYVLIVSGSGLFFYPVSAFGVIGVIAMIGSLNIVMLLSLFPRSAASNWQQALTPVAAAIFLTAVELGALSLLRYAVLGLSELP